MNLDSSDWLSQWLGQGPGKLQMSQREPPSRSEDGEVTKPTCGHAEALAPSQGQHLDAARWQNSSSAAMETKEPDLHRSTERSQALSIASSDKRGSLSGHFKHIHEAMLHIAHSCMCVCAHAKYTKCSRQMHTKL